MCISGIGVSYKMLLLLLTLCILFMRDMLYLLQQLRLLKQYKFRFYGVFLVDFKDYFFFLKKSIPHQFWLRKT